MKYDIIVAGGGIAGCAAALSASRCGKKVLLLERGVMLGGLATGGLINFFEPLCDGTGRQVVYGIAEEMLRRFVEFGRDETPRIWKEGTDEERRAASSLPKGQSRYITHFTPAHAALVLFHDLKAAGVEVVFDALITEVHREENTVTELVACTASGRETFSAPVYIDATGSAELFFRAGFGTEDGSNAYCYCTHFVRGEYGRGWLMLGVPSPWRHSEGERFAGTSREAVNRMIQTGQEELYGLISSGKRKEDIVALPTMPQFREIRRIRGGYTVRGEDANRALPESLGVGGHFEQKGIWYEIPYRALVNEAENVVAAGRIISAEGDAWNATRVIPVAALTGELAGIVASHSLDTHSPVNGLSYKPLSELVSRRGILLRG